MAVPSFMQLWPLLCRLEMHIVYHLECVSCAAESDAHLQASDRAARASTSQHHALVGTAVLPAQAGHLGTGIPALVIPALFTPAIDGAFRLFIPDILLELGYRWTAWSGALGSVPSRPS
jgi:hypothetical protein